MTGAGALGLEVTRTVVVADMVGSTQFLAEHGSERSDEVRRALFSMLAEETRAVGGELIKTTGDGCMSTFTSSATAVEAALAMHRGAQRAGRRMVPIQLRIGIAVGDVTFESGDVFGLAVVVAARLCDQARPLQVLVTQTVADLTGDRGGHRFVSAGSFPLKGIPEPVSCCEVLEAPRDVRPPLPQPLQRGFSEVLVGRERELAKLRMPWKAAVSGSDRAETLVLIQGDAGIGKSRMAAAFAREVHGDDATVLLGRCEPGRNVPYEAFHGPLRDLLATAERSVLRAHVDACGGELTRIVPELTERLAGVPAPAVGDPGVERDRLFDAITDLLARCAREAPLLLVIEDIHWAARSTLELIDRLTGEGAPGSVLIVATFRDSASDRTEGLNALVARSVERRSSMQIELRGLSEPELIEMVSDLAGEELDSGGKSFVAALHGRTAGNPFFAGQVLRDLIERGDLVQDLHGWQTPAVAITELPSGVVDVVRQRLDRLSPAARDVLPLAAVLGQRFSLSDLRLVASDADDVTGLVTSLEEAESARFVSDTAPGQFAFNHAIVREVLLSSMSSSSRALLHLKIGNALANVGGDGPLADARIVAEHYLQASLLGDAEPAAQFALEAAAASLWQADHDGARDLLERAASAIEGLRPVDHSLLHDVLLTLLWILLSRLDSDFRTTLPRAADAARRTGEPERLATVALCVTGMANAGEPEPEATTLLEEALDGLGFADSAIRAYVLASLGFGELLEGRQIGGRHIDEALAIAERLAGTDDEILAQVVVLSGFACVGRPGAAARLRGIDRAMSFSTVGGDWRSGLRERVPLMMAPVLGPEVRGLARLATGDRAAFESSFEELCDIAERTGTTLALGWSHQWRTMLALMDGRFEEAPALGYAAVEAIPTEANYALGYQAQLLWQSVEQGNAGNTVDMLRFIVDTTPGIPAFGASLAIAQLLAGNPEAAEAEADRILTEWFSYARNWLWPQTAYQLAEVACVLAMKSAVGVLLDELDPYAGELLVVGPGVYVVGAYDRVRGSLRSLAGQHDAAVDLLRSGLRLEEQVEAPPLIARSCYWLAKGLATRDDPGDRDEARELAARCVDLATPLGMVALAADAGSLLSDLG